MAAFLLCPHTASSLHIHRESGREWKERERKGNGGRELSRALLSLFISFFEIGFYSVTQVECSGVIIAHLLEYLDYRHMPPCLANFFFIFLSLVERKSHYVA